MAIREADAGTTPSTNVVSLEEAHRHGHGGPVLVQPSFNWNTTDRFAELLSYEMEVRNILLTMTYELGEEEKVKTIKNWLGREGLQLKQTFISSDTEACRIEEGAVLHTG